jgi:malate dehydrogenase (oxaloacetate-decarboxylating)
MGSDAIVLACANPIPEICPRMAIEAGARLVATGRSDLPNQVNNSSIFPGLFRGVLDVRASSISDGMARAAAHALARAAKRAGLNQMSILPPADDPMAAAEVAAAVGEQAQTEGVAALAVGRTAPSNASLPLERQTDWWRHTMPLNQKAIPNQRRPCVCGA